LWGFALTEFEPVVSGEYYNEITNVSSHMSTVNLPYFGFVLGSSLTFSLGSDYFATRPIMIALFYPGVTMAFSWAWLSELRRVGCSSNY
jgi:hypothetical protein